MLGLLRSGLWYFRYHELPGHCIIIIFLGLQHVDLGGTLYAVSRAVCWDIRLGQRDMGPCLQYFTKLMVLNLL
jgi:hypothetical protein